MASFAKNGYIRDLLNAYEGCSFAGFPVHFISDRQIAKGDLKNFKALVVPNAKNISEAIFQKIAAYAKNGGEILLLGNESLSRNEYGIAQPNRNGTLKTFAQVPEGSVKSYSTAYAKLLKKLNQTPIVPIVGEDGAQPYGVESRSVVLENGQKLMYAINLNKYPVSIKLPIGNWVNLRNNLPAKTDLELKSLDVIIVKSK
jgi:hypothetical protein